MLPRRTSGLCEFRVAQIAETLLSLGFEAISYPESPALRVYVSIPLFFYCSKLERRKRIRVGWMRDW